MQDEITKVFEQWTPSLDEDQSPVANGDQQNDWESDENFLLQFDSIIDSDIKELYNRYKDRGNAVVIDKENDDFIPISSFNSDGYRLEDNIPAEILMRELNGSQSTLSSTVGF